MPILNVLYIGLEWFTGRRLFEGPRSSGPGDFGCRQLSSKRETDEPNQ
jgi:hypothetical protein